MKKWHKITNEISSYPRMNERVILAVRRSSEAHVLQGHWNGEYFVSFNGSVFWPENYKIEFWMKMPEYPNESTDFADLNFEATDVLRRAAELMKQN